MNHTRRTRARYPHTRAAAARLIRLHHQRCAGQDPLVRIHRRAQRPREDEGRPAHRRRVKGADVPADRRAQQDVSEPQCTRLLDQPPYMQRNARPLLPDLARLGGASTYPWLMAARACLAARRSARLSVSAGTVAECSVAVPCREEASPPELLTPRETPRSRFLDEP